MGTEVSGIQFHGESGPKRRIAPKAVIRFKEKVRELTRRTRGVKVEKMAGELGRYLTRLDRLFRPMSDAFGAARS